MKDRQDPRSIGDANNDGVTGHSIGTTSRANWITENIGKTIIIMIGVIVIFTVSMILSERGDDEPETLGSQQQQADE